MKREIQVNIPLSWSIMVIFAYKLSLSCVSRLKHYLFLSIIKLRNDSEDELGQLSTAYNKTVASLREMIGKIQSEMEESNQQGKELAASGQEVERTAELVGHAIESGASGREEQLARWMRAKLHG